MDGSRAMNPLAEPVSAGAAGAEADRDATSGSHGAGSTAARNQKELVLLGRIAGHDSAALKELYFLYHRRLARFLTRLTPRAELAEEIINDTFWVVWQRAGDFRGASLVSTWILGIAYRRALKSLKRLRPTLAAEDEGSSEA